MSLIRQLTLTFRPVFTNPSRPQQGFMRGLPFQAPALVQRLCSLPLVESQQRRSGKVRVIRSCVRWSLAQISLPSQHAFLANAQRLDAPNLSKASGTQAWTLSIVFGKKTLGEVQVLFMEVLCIFSIHTRQIPARLVRA